MRDINLIVVHCSATKPNMDIGAKQIRDWHINGNGWSDIGYHKVIRKSGEVEPGRPLERAGAHTKGFNSKSIGICMVGGVDDRGRPEDNFTPAQYDALEEMLVTLKEQFPGAEIKGHRDMSPDANHDGVITKDEWMKDCPCFEVSEFCESRRI